MNGVLFVQDWNEINAGFGEAVLLLDTLVGRFSDFEFDRYGGRCAVFVGGSVA